MSIHQTAKLYGKQARQDNRQSEKFVKKFSHYLEWKDDLFNVKRDELKTLLGV